MTEIEKEYITPKLLAALRSLIKRDSLDGVELNQVIDYMGLIEKDVYSVDEALPYLQELCDKGLIEENNGRYYPLEAPNK